MKISGHFRPFITALFLFVVVAVSASTKITLYMPAYSGMGFTVKGYEGLNEVNLHNGMINNNGYSVFMLDYEGFSLIVMQNNHNYPLILHEKEVTLSLKVTETVPGFDDSKENRFLYQTLSNYEKLNRAIQSLEAVKQQFKNDSAMLEDIARESVRLENEKRSIQERIDDSIALFSAVLLKGRFIIEKYQMITSEEQFRKANNEFGAYVDLYYDKLFYSDMIQRIIMQYLANSEPVQGDQVELYVTDVAQNVQVLLSIFKERIAASEIVNYFIYFYLHRSMIHYAWAVVRAFPQRSRCAVEMPESDEANTFVTTRAYNNKQISTGALSEQDEFFYVAVVDPNCPATIIETLMLSKNTKHQIVVASPGGQNLFWMDNLSPMELLFLKPGFMPVELKDAGRHTLPLIYLVHSSGKIAGTFFSHTEI
ncbi:MAG: hypothetical protein RQ866_00145 [Bacteroidales bacterium]|nr:hypothetical protein [Bacteroidales bacterium]